MTTALDWQQQAMALNALSEITLKLDPTGMWWVQQRVEMTKESATYRPVGQGPTPEEAIRDHWAKVVEDVDVPKLILLSGHHQGKHMRWNGFMWQEVEATP